MVMMRKKIEKATRISAEENLLMRQKFSDAVQNQMEANHAENCIYVMEPSIMNMSQKYLQPFPFRYYLHANVYA